MKNPAGADPCRSPGLVVLDKAAGVSSHRALAPLKRALPSGVRVGHAGTLDPFATGVLLALLGDATRLSRWATALPKTYEARVAFGRATDTLDPEGRVTAEADPGPRPPPGLDRALEALVGEIEQVPPAYSAVKVAGRRAYRRARAGEEVSPPPRRVTVHALRVTAATWPRLDLEVTCSAGTYLRALARDLGRALGLPAHLAALRRTRVGPFRPEQALPVPPSAPIPPASLRRFLRPPAEILRAAGLPEIALDREQAARFGAGAAVRPPGLPARSGEIAVLAGDPPRLLGVGWIEGAVLQPRTVLASARVPPPP